MRLKRIVGLAAAMVMLATAAGANHPNMNTSFTLADDSPDAHSDTTSHSEYGTDHPASGVIHIEGIQIAHENGNDNVGGSGDEPDDGDVVAQIDATARWKALFCAQDTITIDGEWVSPMENPANRPANAVAQIKFSFFTTVIDAWVTEQSSAHGNVSANHYDIETPEMGDSACSWDDVTIDSKTFGSVAGSSPTRHVSQNPSSTGTYDIEATYIDQSSNSHSGSTTYDIN